MKITWRARRPFIHPKTGASVTIGETATEDEKNVAHLGGSCIEVIKRFTDKAADKRVKNEATKVHNKESAKQKDDTTEDKK